MWSFVRTQSETFHEWTLIQHEMISNQAITLKKAVLVHVICIFVVQLVIQQRRFPKSKLREKGSPKKWRFLFFVRSSKKRALVQVL
jgi:hypothetical protein